ncbi:MAG: hypothetical protein QME90_05825 [Thermodesulfobacteriota bacterium]|nr:hypothetical protein [Thermodesulfobacteriota bacterium]
MTPQDLQDIAKKMVGRPLLGRKLYIWLGGLKELRELLSHKIVSEIDLLDLVTEGEALSETDIQRQLKKSLEIRLDVLQKNHKGQQILLVANGILLIRYHVSLNPFYARYLSDRTMVVIQIPKGERTENFPSYVEFHPDEVFENLLNILPEENRNNIVHGGNDG